jgi:acyl-CoA reductase-like NAD-dependent aldehyde dehydrogenase
LLGLTAAQKGEHGFCYGRLSRPSQYRNTRQTCVFANRILVRDGVYDTFAKRLAKAMKVEAHIADAVKGGA